MTSKSTFLSSPATKAKWVYSTLILLIIEKSIQHIFVTLAFYFNWGDIASSVAVAPTVLMILGAFVALLFILSLWGLIKRHNWAISLVVFLALFDIVGEFVAQGTIGIFITVSFIVAVLLFCLALIYRRQVKGR